MKQIIYDIETYPNLFSLCAYTPHHQIENEWRFVISPWQNDWFELRRWLWKLSISPQWEMVGFNSSFFDYPVVHHVYDTCKPNADAATVIGAAYTKAMEIINTPFGGVHRWQHVIHDSGCLSPQIDLFRINHFDNVARMTSLKVLEFNMRSKSIQDLPYPPGTRLNEQQVAEVVEYNMHDVHQTAKFAEHCAEAIEFRRQLTEEHGQAAMNYNDTKIGKQTFIRRLEAVGVECFKYDENNKRQPRQTPRNEIWLKDSILPFIKFKTPELRALGDWMMKQCIKETKGVFTGLAPTKLGELRQYCNPEEKPKGRIKVLNTIVRDFQFDFGTGGIHGSTIGLFAEDDGHVVIDLDVTSYYPSIAIEHHFAPEHLGEAFVTTYAALKRERVNYPKGSVENAALKLALNGVYGDSNNKYSPFYDPKYTMCITVNGQLMLAMLAEALMLNIPGLQMLQINTDGLTIRMPRDQESELARICKFWMNRTRMELERADYKRMWIRDVNNYIGEYTDGKLKRKGAYEHEMEWHQNHSALVIPKAVEAYLVRGVPLEKFINDHDDMHDFMLRTKTPRSSRLEWGGKQVQGTSRYYVSRRGKYLVKVMPPLTNKIDERFLGHHCTIHRDKSGERRVGYKTELMNVFEPDKVTDIDISFYINEARKLIEPFVDNTDVEDLF